MSRASASGPEQRKLLTQGNLYRALWVHAVAIVAILTTVEFVTG